MKVVINKCHGGFGLSSECIWELKNSSCIKKYTFNEYFKKDFVIWPEKDCKKFDWLPKNFTFNIFGTILIDNKNKIIYEFDYNNKKARSCTSLVDIIKEKGYKWASGKYAKLNIVEIPDDINFYIYDYDGMESIHEEHSI